MASDLVLSPGGNNPPLISIWTLNHWPPFSAYDLATSFLSIEQSTNQIYIFPIYRKECCGVPCQRLLCLQQEGLCYPSLPFLTHLLETNTSVQRPVSSTSLCFIFRMKIMLITKWGFSCAWAVLMQRQGLLSFS